MRTLAQLVADLEGRRTSSRALVEECVARIEAPSGEGGRVFVKYDAPGALAAADYHDRMRDLGAAASPFAGIPISIKDLFDVRGEVTTAGSVVLRSAPAAERDAPAVARLRAAGFISLGRTNMTEFAFSGLGINSHYGTPLNPHERRVGRIPGGSTSGGAVSVVDGMAYAALGTDTGGSCRIPAALCGVVGFKPTARRVPLDGAFPLSQSLDSIGPLAASVADCATLDSLLSGESELAEIEWPLAGLRLAVPQSLVLDGLDQQVARSFERALLKLAAAGARITDIPLAELKQLPDINRKGGLVTAEAYAIHRERLDTGASATLYDPLVLSRILRGRQQDAADYLELLRIRADLRRRVEAMLAPYDAVLMPTVPIVAPPLAQLQPQDEYTRVNMLMLRNPSIANFLDRCSISIPCHDAGTLPAGLMIVAAHGADRRLLAIGTAIERLVAPAWDVAA